MKDCKWNPPTAGSKGIHLDEHGRIIERAELQAIPENARMLKLVTEDGDRRARRRAERQVQAWIADGSYAKLLAGEIDPPTGWTLHTHRPGSTTHYYATILRGFALDDRAEAHRPLVNAAINSLLDQGRVSRDELDEAERTFFNARRYAAALELTGSPTSAVELIIRHGAFALHLDDSDPRLGTKLSLLRAAPASFHDPAWSSLVAPGTLLEHAASTGMDPARFAEIVSRAEDISRSAGITADSFSDRYAFGELSKRPAGPLGDDSFALTYLSVLSDPTEQRALAIVLAAADRFGRSPSGLAQDVRYLPDGANDLDALVRFTASHLRAGHIHGDRTTATSLLLECIAGNAPAPSASVTLASSWPHGPLGTISTGELLGTEPSASVASVLGRAAAAPWDTVLLDSLSREEIILAAALTAQRSLSHASPTGPGSSSDDQDEMAPHVAPADPEFVRMLDEESIIANAALLATKPSFRELARRTAHEATAHTSSYETLALAVLADATSSSTQPEQLAAHMYHLTGFLVTGCSVSMPHDAGATTAALAAFSDDCEAISTGGLPDAALSLRFMGLPDPEHAMRLYHQARAAAGDIVGTAVEVCPATSELHGKPYADTGAANTYVATVRLALAPGQTPSAVAARALARLSSTGITADVKLRENEVVVTTETPALLLSDALSSGAAVRAALTAEFSRDNDAARNRVLAARERDADLAARGSDPEFARLLDEEQR